jgi:hypothetical protein
MIVSVNEIIGSIVYRTMTGLNADENFLNGLEKYRFCPAVVENEQLHLWHFPGTQQEISEKFLALSKANVIGGKLKFPAFLNFQDIIQERGQMTGLINVRYNLAIVAPVLSEWTTKDRDERVFKPLLRKIYLEFINQIRKSGYFQVPMSDIPHIYVEVFTTVKGNNENIKIHYGDYVDAIQLTNFTLKVKSNICDKLIEQISKESKQVTESINNLKS